MYTIDFQPFRDSIPFLALELCSVVRKNFLEQSYGWDIVVYDSFDDRIGGSFLEGVELKIFEE